MRPRSLGSRPSWRCSSCGGRSPRSASAAGSCSAPGSLGLYALGFLLATAAAGLATTLDTWVALLIVGIALVLPTAALGVIGISVLKRGVPPIPERAVAEAKLTAETLKGNGRG